MTDSSTLRVLHYSTHNEDCGIGKYQEQFLAAMEKHGDKIYNEFFPYSPHKTKVMTHEQFSNVLKELATTLTNFDILHVQHEFSFYWHDELYRIVEQAHALKKKVIVTVHTAPEGHYQLPVRGGLGPHSVLHYEREKKKYKHLEEVHIKPIRLADLVLVHNGSTKNDLVKHGVDTTKIQVISMPVPAVSFKESTNEITQNLRKQDGDIVFGSVGFISRSKGLEKSIKALSFLPENYKLAIIGGVHPSGHDAEYLDELCDLITQRELGGRVYITGFEPDDKRLNALIRECDVCVYPYAKRYYNYVSSAALNNSIANHKPTLVYATDPFVEMNADNTLAITKSANYYELTRSLRLMDMNYYAKAAKDYAERHSYPLEASRLIEKYQGIARQ